ncbi:MAG: HAMP domain-containing protein [Anaerolineales bacterium]|nr:HAMP domain-containing protein [Anaerolineales bacterium]
MSILVMLAVFTLTFLSIVRERASFQRELISQAELLLETTALTLRDQLYLVELDELIDVANVVSDNPNVTMFAVYDANGIVLVDSSRPELMFSRVVDPLGASLVELNPQELYLDWQAGQLLAGRPVVLGNQPIGAVVTGLSTTPLNQKILSITYQGILLAVFTLAIGAGSTVLLARQITQPLSELADAASKMAAGDLSRRVAPRSGDEVGRLAETFNEMATGLQEREWLRDMFGRFVSQEVADAIRNGQVKLEGENRHISVLFCDIRQFTDFSEHRTPGEAVSLLNEFLPVVVQSAQRHGGIVNKFGGDSTLIIYGAPRAIQDSAYRAVLTALDIRAGLKTLNEQLVEILDAPLRVGVGINTGIALAGAVGTQDRQEYTVIGNTVNLAARIDGLNKQYPSEDILISEWTYEALNHHRSEFELVSLGAVSIRGKDDPVQIWSVKGKR